MLLKADILNSSWKIKIEGQGSPKISNPDKLKFRVTSKMAKSEM